MMMSLVRLLVQLEQKLHEKVKHAKQLSYVDKDGKTVTLDGVDLVKGEKKTQKIKISEQYNINGISLPLTVAIQ